MRLCLFLTIEISLVHRQRPEGEYGYVVFCAVVKYSKIGCKVLCTRSIIWERPFGLPLPVVS